MGAIEDLHSNSGCFLFLCHVTLGKSLPSLKLGRQQSAIITLRCCKDKNEMVMYVTQSYPAMITKTLLIRNAGSFGQSYTGISL